MAEQGRGNNRRKTGIVVRYNIIHDIGNKWSPWGYVIFYNDAYSSGYAMHSNLIYNISVGGDSKTQIFGKMRASVAYNNLVFNTGSGVMVTSNQISDGWFRWWRDLYDSGCVNSEKNYQLFDNLSFGSSDWLNYYKDKPYDEAYSFNMLMKLRSSDFFYKMYGSGLAYLNNGKPETNGGIIAITDENIGMFRVQLTTARTNQADGTNMYKGKQLKAGASFTFETVDEMFTFLYDCCGYQSGNNCVGANVYYGASEKVVRYYANLYKYEEQYAEIDEETGDVLYPPSKYGYDAGARKGDVGSIFPEVGIKIGDVIGRDYFKTNNAHGYLGEYFDNVTINCAQNFSTDNYEHSCVKRRDYIDVKSDMIGLFNEDGNDFSQELYDYIENIHAQGKLKEFTLINSDIINKCGANRPEYDT